MNLYIANTTKQHHIFYYKHPEGEPEGTARVSEHRFRLREVPFRPGLRYREIKAGTQICIGDLTAAQIDVIVQQYEVYGIRDARQMSRLKGFVGFSYNVGNPVPIEAMLATFETNDKVLDERARERTILEAAEVSNVVAKGLLDATGQRATEENIEKVRPNVEVSHLEEDSDSRTPLNIGAEARRDRKPHRARQAA